MTTGRDEASTKVTRMKKSAWVLIAALGVLALACGKMDYIDHEPRNAKETISRAQSIFDPNERISYLLRKAQFFLDNYDYVEAFDIAYYVLQRDPLQPIEAKIILEKAQKGIRERESDLQVIDFDSWEPSSKELKELNRR